MKNGRLAVQKFEKKSFEMDAVKAVVEFLLTPSHVNLLCWHIRRVETWRQVGGHCSRRLNRHYMEAAQRAQKRAQTGRR